MRTLYKLGLWSSKIRLRQVAPWLLLYSLVCVLWAGRMDPAQQSVFLAFAPIWAGWMSPIERRTEARRSKPA